MIQIDEAVSKIRRFYIYNKRLPTYREMCDLFEYKSKKAAFYLAKKLINEGILSKDERGRLLPKRLFLPMRLYGSIKAGFPAPAEEQIVDTLDSFDTYLINKPEMTFLLRVSGDSMIDAGINSGDIVVVERGRSVRNGDVVVAFVDDEWTLKHFHKENDHVLLIPANKNYQVIIPKKSLEIGGVVISVIRKYH